MHVRLTFGPTGQGDSRPPRRGLRKYASTPRLRFGRMESAAVEAVSEPPELPSKRSYANLKSKLLPDHSTSFQTYTMAQPMTQSPDLHHDTEDETSSEAHEPVTPNSDSHSHSFHHHQPGSIMENTTTAPPTLPKLKTLPIPAQPAATPVASNAAAPKTPDRHHSDAKGPRPKMLTRQSTASKISKFFHRKGHDASVTPVGEAGAAPAALPPDLTSPIVSSERRYTISKSADASPSNSVSHSPPSGHSPTHTVNQAQPENWLTVPPEENMSQPKRSSTGLKDNVRGIVFNLGHKEPRPRHNRSSSMSRMDAAKPTTAYSITAEAGVGLKARRMSASLPEDFIVESVELNNEFSSSSLLPGRRGKTVGKGATASVKLMAKKGGPSDVLYAVKEFRKKSPEENERDYERKVMSEYCIAKSLHHPNIVESIRLCTHGGRWNHVMEYIPLEVHALVAKGYFKTEDQNCIFKQLVRAVAHLHKNGIAHRDIKLENMLMTLDGQVKLTDFGVSEVFCGDHPGVRAAAGQCGQNMKEIKKCAPAVCGSPPYLPPEVMEKKVDYDPRLVDIWSCAMVLLTLRFNGQIWMAPNDKEHLYGIFIRGYRSWLNAHPDNPVPTSTSDLPKCGPPFGHLKHMTEKRCILRMLHPNPEHRITTRELMEDNWFKNIECCSPSPTDDGTIPPALDASAKKSCKFASKSVRRTHHHLPPANKVPTFGIHLKDAD